MWIYILANITVCNCCLIVMVLMMIKLDVKLHLVNYLSINMEQTINMLKIDLYDMKGQIFFFWEKTLGQVAFTEVFLRKLSNCL